jgi:hypothetical protein
VGDYDNDGDDDIYFVNGRPDLNTPSPEWHNALFRNDGGFFTDVTKEAGVGDTGYGMSAAFGDVDNDGWLDLFVGNYGPNVLYHNNGDGTFTDITEQAGVGDAGYVAATAFADADRDGDLDLFVGNYVAFDPEKHGMLRDVYHGIQVFAGPHSRTNKTFFIPITEKAFSRMFPNRRRLTSLPGGQWALSFLISTMTGIWICM